MGIMVHFRTTVGDYLEEIVQVLQKAVERCDMVITTGGLGPTQDDLTREAVSRAAGVDLEFRQDLMNQISTVFDRSGFLMPENNRRQAFVPKGSLSIQNPVGTAPGFVKEMNGKPVICLPGVPRELKYLLNREVATFLRERFCLAEHRVTYRVLKAVGISESRLDTLIGDLMKQRGNTEVGLLASQGEIQIRIAARGKNHQQIRALIEPVVKEIRSRLGNKIYGEEKDTFEGVIDALLAEHNLTLALLETFSGGLAAQKFHALPSSRLVESLVLTEEKRVGTWLGRKDIELNGETALNLARKVTENCGSKVGLATLGFPKKKEEIYYLKFYTAIVGEDIHISLSREMRGDFPVIKQWAVILSLDALRLALLDISGR